MIDEGLQLLDEDECFALMATAPVGRVGITVGALPAILPVNFAVRDRTIYFCTGDGTKLDAATRHAVVAFEVDGYDPFEHTGWSVLAVGTASRFSDSGDLSAVPGLRVGPWAGGRRDHVVHVPVEFVSGRRIVPGAGRDDGEEW